MKGLVIENTGSFYKVKTKDKEIYTCKIRGKFRLENFNLKNPVAIGDLVEFILPKKEDLGLIINILPRKNYISRISPYNFKINQILASNLDLVILVALPIFEEANLLFIDKFLLSAKFFNVNPLILFNKIDLLDDEKKETLKKMKDSYKKIGFNSMSISAIESKLDNLKKILKNKITLLTGNSGVGKSTIINKIIPTLKIKVREISSKTNKGKHTTSYSKMFDLDENSYIIDSPGIQSFYPSNIKIEDIYLYFPDFKKYSNCKFYNCIHIYEPNCGVKDALHEGLIQKFRYNNYKKIIEEKIKLLKS
ncbi:MAG: ribosome small subunit-dependent GTPase A [Bacteroidetes bacterium]|nr:ribosome small subunit-dependent GTPase A [Bacteroidota bacterium]